MATKLTGRARIFGLAGAATYTSFPATAAWLPQGAEMTHDYQYKNVLHDPSTGEPISIALGREVREASLELIVVGASGDGTQTVAEAAAVTVLPAAPFKVTLSGFADADLNADFIYVGGCKKSYTPEGDMKMTLPLIKYVGLDASALTALLATVS